MKSNEELRQLALDIGFGLVFTTWHLLGEDRTDMAYYVFLPLIALSQKEKDKLIEDEVTMFYEYMSKSCSNSINGYPIFFSMQHLTKTEARILDKYIKKISEALANV